MPVVADKTIDCLGLFCPMPIVKTREALLHMEAGQVLEVTSDDPGSEADMKSWSARTGNELVEPGGELVYEVEQANPFAIFGGMGL